MAKLPTSAAILACLCLTSCASWGTHADSVDACERGFEKDPDWNRDKWPGRQARRLVRKFPTFEFEGRTSRPLKPSTLWFRNDVSGERASCSMHSCDLGRCVWRVRLYANHEGQWSLRSQYDLGKPYARKAIGRKVTGR